ncbi:MAG: hypothetical protein II670_10350 [Alphaproteobacteria bacterium]|nr:hypothetical protein [Alphaproteobacteria bacterium]
MTDIYGYNGEFQRSNIFNKIDMIDEKLAEEEAKEPEKRNANKEFELMYAKFIAGLKLSTGARLY